MCSPNSSPYWKSNSFWPRFSTGMASFEARAPWPPGDVGRAELLVHQAPVTRRRRRPARTALQHALEDQVLRVRDRLGLLRRRVALDPEHLLLEGTAVVEREDVELAVVAECSCGGLPPDEARSTYTCVDARSAATMRAWSTASRAPRYTLGVEEELMIVDAETLDLSNSIEGLLADLRDAGDRGRGQAGADGVGLRDRHDAVPQHRARPARQLRALRRTVQAVAAERGLAHRLGRHPPVRALGGPADRVAAALPRPDRGPPVRRPPGDHLRHPRARGLDDPDKAIHVTNGMRVHLPLLLALSANSPFWRGDQTGLLLHPHADLPRVPARGHPAALRRLRGLDGAGSTS